MLSTARGMDPLNLLCARDKSRRKTAAGSLLATDPVKALPLR